MPEVVPTQARSRRGGLPARSAAVSADGIGMTHEQLLEALRAVDGLVDVGHDPPNFHFRSRPFLHFHLHEEGMFADVRFGNGDFEPIWAATPQERAELLARVAEHVEHLQSLKKAKRGKAERARDR